MNNRHLEYESVEDWIANENVPPNFVSLDDSTLRDKYITEYGELRRHLFAKHAATLSLADQKKLSDGTHPSQSHEFASDAEPYCQVLDTHLKSLGIVADEIVLGWYHMDRIVLTVYCDESRTAAADQKPPWLFQGFEVFYLPRKDEVTTEP
jgi:hypothetical protein